MELAYLGHATCLLSLGGTAVLTDPFLRSRLGILRRHGPMPDAGALRPGLVVVSHLHRDHLDLPSLRRLDPSTPVIAPRGAATVLARAGLEDVTEVRAGDEVERAGIRLIVTEAVHDARRDPWGPTAEPVGFVLEGEGERAYFPGDTDVFEGMAELGPLDLALMPVWGWGPNLGPGHLDPAASARALRLLEPRVAVPIHWGTLYPAGLERLKPKPLAEPPVLFSRLASGEAPQVDVRVLAPGSRTEVPA